MRQEVRGDKEPVAAWLVYTSKKSGTLKYSLQATPATSRKFCRIDLLFGLPKNGDSSICRSNVSHGLPEIPFFLPVSTIMMRFEAWWTNPTRDGEKNGTKFEPPTGRWSVRDGVSDRNGLRTTVGPKYLPLPFNANGHNKAVYAAVLYESVQSLMYKLSLYKAVVRKVFLYKPFLYKVFLYKAVLYKPFLYSCIKQSCIRYSCIRRSCIKQSCIRHSCIQ